MTKSENNIKSLNPKPEKWEIKIEREVITLKFESIIDDYTLEFENLNKFNKRVQLHFTWKWSHV